ncbi:MAG: DinB family protein [Gemmatimonadales bacterium]
MQKRLAEVISYIDASRVPLLESVAHVHPSFAEICPRDGTWSVAEILTHLALVEAGVAKLVARSVLWGKEKGIGPETSDESVLSSLDEFAIIERPKFTSPERLIPPHDSRMDEALRMLGDSRRALLDALVEGDGMDLSAIKRPHPVFGELNIYQWSLFIGKHEERHTRQIQRTLRDLQESAAESAPMF